MSSMVRRLEKSLMKKAGYVREKYIIVKGRNGEPVIRPVRRCGIVSNPDGDSIGRHWPDRIPARASPPTRKVEPRARAARGSRRGKPSKAWIAKRQAAKAA